MKSWIVLWGLPLLVCGSLGCTGGELPGEAVKLQGAGGTFPAPLYNKWFQDYRAKHPHVLIDYQAVGSGAGIKAVIDGTVQFGASDAAMTPEEMAQVARGVQCLPLTAGSIVLAYNLPEVENLKLSREAYVGIFLGKVTRWNDPLIVKSNAGVKLPDSSINVVERADSSGTSFVFTNHLSAISKEFAASPGRNEMPNWPVGTRSKGNQGVTASIKTTPGSIGYIEYGYAMSTKMPTAMLENKSGVFVKATPASGLAALAGENLPENLIDWVSDPEGKDAYPIVTYTWLLCYKKYEDKKELDALKDVIKYCLTEGQKSSEELGYIPLPANVVEKVEKALDNLKAGEAK